MRIALVTASVLLVLPAGAGADAISPPPPCEPGFSRDVGGPLGGIAGGLWGHGGAPRCQPAVCQDASTCGPGQQCREDAHCIQARTERELRPSPGHGARFDPDDPASWHDVERLYDGGQCAEGGECPDGWRCVVVATCRPEGDNDSAIAANGRGTEAVRAWRVGRPFATAAPETLAQEPERPSPDLEEPTGEPTPEDEETEATPTESTSGRATNTPPAGCGCIASGRPRTSPWGLAAIVLFALRRRRS